MSDKPIIVAHRAGNEPTSAKDALDRADVVELDLHVFRRRVEVRHEKVLWPTARLWERWFLLPKGTRAHSVDDILAAVGPATKLMLDLKCFTPFAAMRIRRSIPEDQPAVVSCRSWWVLPAFRDRPATPMLRSCRSRRQLWLALRLPGLGDRVGIVAHESLLDRTTVQAVRAKTPLLYSWAIETVDRAGDLVDAGVVGLIVDDLSLNWP